MFDPPSAGAILADAIRHLRDEVLPAVSGRPAFDVRLVLSALAIVEREMQAPRDADDIERAALKALLDSQETDLASLNRLLAERIEAGAFSTNDPALIRHLRGVAMAKLAVDQPGYGTYRHHLAREG
jgi:hypothetical protein